MAGNPRRLGVIQRAIQNRDADALMAEIIRRSHRDRYGCLLWTRQSPDGYPMVGSGDTAAYVHRLVAWSTRGFPGELRDFPATHHRCANRRCVEPQHVVPVSSLLNTVEAETRTMLVNRIRFLEDIVRSYDPNHEGLQYPEFEGGDIHQLRTGPQSATPARIAEIAHKRAARRAALAAHAQVRYEQVRVVQRMVSGGVRRADALQQIGISRTAYDNWRRRLDRLENKPPEAA